MQNIDKIEVKKYLYKSKGIAKLSYYEEGNLYYFIELEDGKYLVPIPIVEKVIDGQFGTDLGVQLSSEIGKTKLGLEIKASDLNRWIAKAIDNDKLIQCF